MKKVFLPIIAFCMMLFSCGTDTKKSDVKIRASEPIKPTAEEIAHQHGCITVDEFAAMRFTYVIEKKLPCRMYVENFQVNDIIPKIKESSVYVWAECEEYEGDVEGEVKYSVLPDWVGTPTSRKNECWMDCYMGYIPQSSVSGYIGLDKTQVDWVVKMAMETNLFYPRIDAPIIIRVDQVRKDGGISIKADLVAILDEE